MTTPRKILLALSATIAAVALLDFVAPPPIDRASETSKIVLDRNGVWLNAFATKEGRWRFPAQLDEIDPVFIEELIAVEDKRFRSHWGVDLQALARAARDAVSSRKITSGASTITMQTARLLEPRPRTLGSKLIEMIRALQIERRLSKDEILELYLTLTPYGGNIEGVDAASLIYFGKAPSRLSPSERALLIALPQAPEARRPDRKIDNARVARNEIANRLAGAGMLSSDTALEIETAALPVRRNTFPSAAYHASSRLAASDPRPRIPTTLDIAVQSRVAALIERYGDAASDGATAAAIVVDNATSEVIASIGSSGLDAPGGWIDLTDAKRSPGSLLKPFIYALAFEDGSIAASTIIADSPRAFGDYQPENFDRMFRGEVRVREALQHSLNIPAVTTLERVGANRFDAVLRDAGAAITTRRSATNGKGLAIALGGGGLTVREIAQLYAGLARGGEVQGLEWLASAPEAPSHRIVSRQNAERITAILQGAPSLEGRAPAALTVNTPLVAYKTGTSYGFRDAWAAGYTRAYTVVVWTGRADGAPRPGMTGRKAAAPVLFDIFDEISSPDERSRPLEEEAPLMALNRLRGEVASPPPAISFPVDGAEVFVTNFDDAQRGFALSGRGRGKLTWYVDGIALGDRQLSEQSLWRPMRPGFYEISLVDEDGETATSRVRVLAGA